MDIPLYLYSLPHSQYDLNVVNFCILYTTEKSKKKGAIIAPFNVLRVCGGRGIRTLGRVTPSTV